MVWACFWITCPSTGVVAEKDGGFLHHHRVGEAEQGPSTGGKKEGVRHGIPRKLRIIPAIQRSEVLVGQVEMLRCSAFCRGLATVTSTFVFKTSESSTSPNKHSSLSKHGPIVKKYQET